MKNKKAISWQIPKELHDKIVKLAEIEKRSVTQMAVIILENYFKNKANE